MVPIVDAWIERIAGWVERRPGRFLIVAGGLNALFVVAFGALSTFPEDGPDGVDLQLSLSANVFHQIVAYWQEAGFDIARFQWTVAGLDFFFPVAYATFLCGVYQLVCRGALLTPRRLILFAPFAAAVADYVENVVMLWLLARPLPPVDLLVRVMSGAAIIKLGLLTATSAFVIAAIIKGDAWRVLKIARYTVLSLLLGTLPLLLLPQGRDLLTSLSHPAAFWHRLWFVLWLVVWALSAWYWSRVLLDAEADRGESPEFTSWSTWLPRVTGAATLVVPGLAILGGVPDSENRLAMVILGLSCLVFGIVFLVFVIRRRHRQDHKGYRAADKFARDAVKRPSELLVAGSLAVSGVLFIWFTAAPQSAGMTFGAVAILAIVAANTVFFGSIVVFLMEARRIPIEIVALACAAVFSFWNDNHNVVVEGPLPSRETLDADFARWLTGLPGDPKTVIIATGEGGGIRAAYWTAAVLHYLDNDADPRLRGLQFSRRLYAISTVSGSSFGAAVYAGLKHDLQGTSGQLALASSVLQRQFLAPMIAKLVTGDVAQWFLPFPYQPFDRSTALEEGFARAYVDRVPAAKTTDTMKKPFASFAANRKPYMPLLFFNGTSVQSGRRLVTSGVRWLAPGSDADDVDPIDFHALLQGDISLARAAHNSARFPYVSPAGRLRDQDGTFRGHIVDGGYFENTGADTAFDLITYLDQKALTSHVRFVVIALANSLAGEVTIDRNVAWRKTKHLGELFAPFRALLQTRDARGTMALNRLRARVQQEHFVEFRVCDDKDDDRESRDAPLGWQLSAEMVAELNSQFGLRCFHDSVDKLVRALGTPAP